MRKTLLRNTVCMFVISCATVFAGTSLAQDESSSSPAGFGVAPSTQRRAVAAAESPVFNGNLNGVVVSSTEWTSSAQSHPGLYKLNSDLTKELLLENRYMTGSAAVYIRGKMYFATSMAYGTYVVDNSVWEFDIDNLAPIGAFRMPLQMAQIAVGYVYDRMSDKAYAITYNQTGSSYVLNNFDYEKRTYSAICNINETYFALTFTPDGTLYGIDKNGVVKTISLTDGTATEVVSTGLTPLYVQSAVYSPKDKAIIWMATLSDGSRQIVKIDPVAKTAEKLADYTDEVIGLYTNDEIALDGAPAQPSDVAVSYATHGTNNATISFTMPDRTVDGASLSGNLDVEIVVDGDTESAATGSGATGSDFSKEVDLGTAGLHKVAIYVKNDAGKCQPAIMKAFGGYDTPSEVTDLQYTLDDNGHVTLTWGASKAINNGYTGTISYKVKRNGEDVMTTTETTFSETLGNDLELYSYSVVPVANDIEGKSVSTEYFVHGDALALPYTTDFSNPNLFKLFTPVDFNEDNSTWFLSDWTQRAVYQAGSKTPDDYLVTPPFRMEAYHTYAVSFDAALDFNSDPCTLEVVACNGNTREALEDSHKASEAIVIDSRDNRRVEGTYMATADGTGNFAIHVTDGPSWFKVNVQNLSIRDLGNITAPAGIEDLTVIPEGNGSLKTKVTFTVPSRTIGGSPLEKVSRVELSRDGEFIRAFSNVNAGQKIEFEDEVDMPSFYTYSVAAINESGTGDEAESRVYVGSYSCPVTFLDDSRKSDFRNFVVIDSNEDNCTWRWDEDENAARYRESASGAPSDYLFSPMVELQAGKVYEISYDAHVTADSKGFVLFTKLSRTMQPNDILVYYPAQVVRSTSDFEHISKFIQVPADGTYSVSIVADGVMNVGDGVFIKNISVKEGPANGTPAAVTNLSAQSAPKGELKATLTFTLPSENIMGEAFGSEELLKAEVYDRNGDLCGELQNAGHPGDIVTLDVKALQGINRFTVYATNDAGKGDKESCAVFCGMDTPFRVNEIYSKLSLDNMSTVLSWGVPVEATNKGYFNADELEYYIYLIDENGGKAEIAKTKETEYTFNTYDSSLRKYTFGVLPATKAGMGTQVVTHFNQLGRPEEIPFEETFANGEYSTAPWYSVNMFDTTLWETVTSADEITADDNGFIFFHDTYNHATTADLYLPKISLNGVTDARLDITTWQYYSAKALFRVFASADDNVYDFLGTAFCDNVDEIGKSGWHTWSFDLTPYIDGWVQIRLEGTIDNDFYGAINDIRIGGTELGLSVVEAAGMRAYNEGESIIVKGAAGRNVTIYGIDGRAIYSGIPDSDSFRIPVPAGIYIATADGLRLGKIAVK